LPGADGAQELPPFPAERRPDAATYGPFGDLSDLLKK
jgi:hypothetical protein